MPFPEFGKKRGLVRPNVKAEVNWAHPYASALAGAWAFGGLAGNTGLWADEVTGNFAPKITTTSPTTIGYFANSLAVGPCVNGSLSATVGFKTNCLSSQFANVSVLAVCMKPVTSTSGTIPFIIGSSAGGGGNGFSFYIGQYPSGDKLIWDCTSGTSLALWVDGIKQTATGGTQITSNSNLPITSKWFCVGATGTLTAHAYANVYVLAPFDNANFIFLGPNSCSFIAVFNKVLPDSMMADLTINPYDLLVFPNQFDMPIMAPGPSFISGWSRQSNLPVIGGGTF